MKNEFPTARVSRIALAFMLSVLLPSHVSADLLGDLNQAVDLMKKVGASYPPGIKLLLHLHHAKQTKCRSCTRTRCVPNIKPP